jgi:hypothetical protein
MILILWAGRLVQTFVAINTSHTLSLEHHRYNLPRGVQLTRNTSLDTNATTKIADFLIDSQNTKAGPCPGKGDSTNTQRRRY